MSLPSGNHLLSPKRSQILSSQVSPPLSSQRSFHDFASNELVISKYLAVGATEHESTVIVPYVAQLSIEDGCDDEVDSFHEGNDDVYAVNEL